MEKTLTTRGAGIDLATTGDLERGTRWFAPLLLSESTPAGCKSFKDSTTAQGGAGGALTKLRPLLLNGVDVPEFLVPIGRISCTQGLAQVIRTAAGLIRPDMHRLPVGSVCTGLPASR